MSLKTRLISAIGELADANGGSSGPARHGLEHVPMWCVSSCTVGISLSGMCPGPPSPQQPRQHANIAAILCLLRH